MRLDCRQHNNVILIQTYLKKNSSDFENQELNTEIVLIDDINNSKKLYLLSAQQTHFNSCCSFKFVLCSILDFVAVFAVSMDIQIVGGMGGGGWV